MLTQEYLQSILHYDKDTGIFTWLQLLSKKIKTGNIAGTYNNKKYRQICINGKSYKAHRLAWFYTHGSWPNIIDHINGIVSDNSLNNLRNGTQRENNINRSIHRGGKLPGFQYDKKCDKYQSKIRIGYKNKHIGYYNTKLEAYEAYVSMAWIINEVNKL